jgi:hypothetical protein
VAIEAIGNGMAQNVQHWLLDRDRFTWAREAVSVRKWTQIRKYFPGERLRRQMMYVDAETGEPVPAEGGEEVPAGKVYIYGYDLRNFCGIDVPGLDEAMSAAPRSRVQQRATQGDPGARQAQPAGEAAAAGEAAGPAGAEPAPAQPAAAPGAPAEGSPPPVAPATPATPATPADQP